MIANIKIIFLFFCLSATLASGCVSSEKPSSPSSPDKTIPPEQPETPVEVENEVTSPILPGAHQWQEYRHLVVGKNVAMVVNQTSMAEEQHLVDFLLEKGISISTIFAPEHGFRGQADAGEQIKDGKDLRTGIPVISLYGKKKKPLPADLKGIDLIIFDIQDVGARFYTYISSMHYVMEACAENDISFLVLDRPNPNGHYVDGPVLDRNFQSFVGMHEVPIVHGMTVAEYARMINGEAWLANGVSCDLHYVVCENYHHQLVYDLPVKPSPNLPNLRSIYLYPSLCLFEGTMVNVGRGTKQQFQVYGHPDFKKGNYEYTPVSMLGAKYPKFKGQKCYGMDWSQIALDQARAGGFNLSYLLNFYEDFPNKSAFFLENNFFDKLAGNRILREQIKAGKTAEEIRASWEPELSAFKMMRKKYLLYP